MGPQTEIGEWIHSWKYRGAGEGFNEYSNRVAGALQESPTHFRFFKDILQTLRFLPGGRIQSAMGSARQATPYNCFVMETIHDDMSSILSVFGDAIETMRRGGGVGYDFSNLRPNGDRIRSLDSISSGPVSFMGIFDAGCKTVSSAGHRRGAQMGVLRVDHPDIERFIHAKQNLTQLTAFNISIAITDKFMLAVEDGTDFDLMFEGKARQSVNARLLWEQIMRSTYDWAEPGVIFIDRINEMNNLYYCETIAATNPCGEQPLPPNGACLLGSFNLTQYKHKGFDWDLFKSDIPLVVTAMDNVIDRAKYPLPAQEAEALNKRRMGLGVTGLANIGEALGHPYGSDGFIRFTKKVMKTLRDETYRASIELAKTKGAFPLFDRDLYCKGAFIKTLPEDIQQGIYQYGIRNSHLTSVAPTGTISITADNVSSGIEPVFSLKYNRAIQTEQGERVVEVEDYGQRVFGVKGKVMKECSVDDHLAVLLATQEYVDSACSKTCNISPDIEWEAFKDIYMRAWKGGAKGCTTFNPKGKRFGILNVPDEPETIACYVDMQTGERSCE